MFVIFYKKLSILTNNVHRTINFWHNVNQPFLDEGKVKLGLSVTIFIVIIRFLGA